MEDTKLRRALVRGRRADFWHYGDKRVVLRHPNGRDRVEVHVDELRDRAAMEARIAVFAQVDWISRAALAELREMVEAAA